MKDDNEEDALRSYAGIKALYQKWRIPPIDPDKGWYQRRGYAFEQMLNALFSLELLDPRTNYRPPGEEIDGSIMVNGHTYLLEAKWWKSPLPASQLYAFKGKVDGKLAGTLGIFISHSGFADDAVDALVSGKGINMILFEGSDFEAILNEEVTFVGALEKKSRYAAENGQPFLPISPRVAAQGDDAGQTSVIADVNVIVESESDEAGLSELLSILSPALAERTVIWPALGSTNLVPLSQRLTRGADADVTVFLDAEGIEPARLVEISDAVRDSGAEVVVFTPSFIAVLERACETNYYNNVPETSIRSKHARRMARHTNPEWLWEASPELRLWMNLRAAP